MKRTPGKLLIDNYYHLGVSGQRDQRLPRRFERSDKSAGRPPMGNISRGLDRRRLGWSGGYGLLVTFRPLLKF
ncbi:hypothetical protein [Luteibacter sp. ME-Dv--P-043b]|uniref:hypothetical protein n=1 Tax=Luteibacter sp. ME-Dv--P-043b TaxID=3040291 RepID=UPI002552E119|nr:hypothetical protein [Luteibacter sp. ME-Dv--P-043b]